MNNTLFEEYKLFVELMDRLAQRRDNMNKFYITIISAIFALNITESSLINDHTLPSILGIALCVVWFIHIRSFRLLNRGKFKVINEMEQQLPYACFDKEWQFIRDNEKNGNYLLLSKIEQAVPVFMGLLFLATIIT